MEFREIKPSNRLEFELENDDSALRKLRGIVLAVGEKSIILITDYGELQEVFEDKVLSITSISMPKPVSDSMSELKAHYSEIYELELRLKELREKEPALKQQLYDANFLARFNMAGAKNRLDKSIDPALLFFKKDTESYQVSFATNPNNQIEIMVLVSNLIEYYNLDEVRDVDKIIRVHAPNIKDVLEKCFPFASKPQEIEKKVVHKEESMYSICVLYRMNVDVSRDTFLQVRSSIIKGLEKLQ